MQQANSDSTVITMLLPTEERETMQLDRKGCAQDREEVILEKIVMRHGHARKYKDRI